MGKSVTSFPLSSGFCWPSSLVLVSWTTKAFIVDGSELIVFSANNLILVVMSL